MLNEDLIKRMHPFQGRGMEYLSVQGGNKLYGTYKPFSSKNAALPLIAATLLSEKVTIRHVPCLGDVATLCQMLEYFGSDINEVSAGDELNLKFDNTHICNKEAPYDLVRKMRASILVMGPLLARYGFAKISLPGGCAIGARPIDIHLAAFEQMGAEIELCEGYVIATARNGLKGAEIHLPFPSVGATENIIMAAALAKGKTIIHQAAQEPEVFNLVQLLMNMGVKIEMAGSSSFEITPPQALHSEAEITVMDDRIQTGSIILAVLTSGGEICVKNAANAPLQALYSYLEKTGVTIKKNVNDLTFIPSQVITPIHLTTQCFPGFPTDLQAQMMAYLCFAKGTSSIDEQIFENRFMHVPELQRMGANITLKKAIAMVEGKDELVGADVMATDLRASMCLVVAALRAKGHTKIHRLYHLDRGYEQLDMTLNELGADVRRDIAT